MRRHYLKHKRENHKNSATPPAGLRQQRASLSNAYERVRGALAAEVCSQTAALPALQENGADQNDRIDY